MDNRAIPINRDFMAEFSSDKVVNTIFNGWFINTKVGWYRDDIAPPQISWPPSKSINPLFISFYITPGFLPVALSEQGIEYLKKHAPIGARDYFTYNNLQKKGIPSYFSGCLTLTLDNPYQGIRDNIIYAVDVDKECLAYIKAHSKTPIIELSHNIPKDIFFRNNNNERLEYAESILNKYRKAKFVITGRIHAALPCLAFKTPVLLITNPCFDRISGLKELLYHCSKRSLIRGDILYDFDHPPENPNTYLQVRENLINSVNQWLEMNSYRKKLE